MAPMNTSTSTTTSHGQRRFKDLEAAGVESSIWRNRITTSFPFQLFKQASQLHLKRPHPPDTDKKRTATEKDS
jgi:hypothetical protein